MTSPHTCHAEGCEVRVPRRMFMCRDHWRALPRVHRERIWLYYEPGQEQRMDPSRLYLAAANAAIDNLAGRGDDTFADWRRKLAA